MCRYYKLYFIYKSFFFCFFLNWLKIFFCIPLTGNVKTHFISRLPNLSICGIFLKDPSNLPRCGSEI